MLRVVSLVVVVVLLSSKYCYAIDHFSNHRILLIYSYHPSFPTSPHIIKGIKSAFSDSNPPIIDVEYMDSKRLNDATSQENYFKLLRYKLSKRSQYDLIISADDNALDFIVRHKASLFKHTDLVFLGVNNLAKARSLDSVPWATGVIEAASFKETLMLSKGLMPERNRLHVIFDNRKSSLSMLSDAREAIKTSYGFETKELNLAKLTWSDLAVQLKHLGKQDVIVLLSAYQDREQVSQSFEESLSMIVQATDAPILHFWEHGIGSGALGGVIVNFQEQGRQAGMMARRILSGEPTSNINVLLESPNLPMLDQSLLAAYAINAENLPDNTVWRNELNSTWKRYKQSILIISLVLLSLLVLTIFLGRHNLKMRVISKRLEQQRSFLRLLMNTLPDLVWIKDPHGIYISCNKRFEEFVGAKESQIVGRSDYDFFEREQAASFIKHDQSTIARNKTQQHEEDVFFSSTGEQISLETIKTPIHDLKNNKLLGIMGVGRDISDRKAKESALRLSASVVDNTAEGVIIANSNFKVVEVNNAFSEITQYKRAEVLNTIPSFLHSEQYGSDLYNNLKHSIQVNGRWSGEFINKRKDGSLYHVWQTISAIHDERGQLSHYVAVFSDISSLKQSQQEALHLAYHDVLTNLPNRLLLKERLEQAIKHAIRRHQTFAVMFLDLDNFKNTNDTRGHAAGDQLLKDIAQLLVDSVRVEDTVARVGGDEFVLLFEELDSPDRAAQLAEKILTSLRTSKQAQHSELAVSASIGICLFPQDGYCADDLLKNADTAMYRAKHQGKNTYQFYTEELTRDIIKRVELESELRQAISNQELCLYYQPQVNLVTGELVGVEALLRWNSSKLGPISPEEFIPIAEESNLIQEIGPWVLKEAAQQALIWLDMGVSIGRIAVNVAGPQITRDDALAEQVSKILEQYQLSPAQLAIEVTESFIMEQSKLGVNQLLLLQEMGIELAIDDFGTGYSSLSHLKSLPISKLKIDKSFIKDIPIDCNDMEISRTIVALGSNLGLKVIAEGVETEEQAKYLREIGCDEAQGYLYGKAMSAHELEQYCRALELTQSSA